MLVNGQVEIVGAGDVCITRHGETHSLINTGRHPLRMLVVAAQTGEEE
jgi:mannose-6-phosphate isomerase-like protein (cupin superfamily)